MKNEEYLKKLLDLSLSVNDVDKQKILKIAMMNSQKLHEFIEVFESECMAINKNITNYLMSNG